MEASKPDQLHYSFIKSVLSGTPQSHTLLPTHHGTGSVLLECPKPKLSRRLMCNEPTISEKLSEFCTWHGIHSDTATSAKGSTSDARMGFYFLSITPSVNYTDKSKTQVSLRGKMYTLDGFTLVTEKDLQKTPPLCFQQYGYTYSVKFEPASEQIFSALEALLFEEYLFNDLLQLYNFTYVLNHIKPAIYFIPRFTSSDMEVLDLNHLLQWLMDTHKPLIPYFEAQLKERTCSDIEKLCEGLIVTNPHMCPSSVRIDRVEWLEQNEGTPNVVHFSSFYNEDRMETEDTTDLHETFRASSKEFMLNISPEGFLVTGLYSDIVQHTLLLPLVLHHVLYHQSLSSLETKLNYSFQDRQLLERALTHPLFSHYGSVVAEQVQVTASNCGVRRPQIREERREGGRGIKAEVQRAASETERERMRHNEQLEFLGDAALEYLCSLHLFHMFPDARVGQLASYRTLLVKNRHLATLARKLEIHKYHLVGGYQQLLSGTHREPQVHCSDESAAVDSMDGKALTEANAIEAIVGAVYLDSGLRAAQLLTAQLFFPEEDLRKVWIEYPPHPLQVDHSAGDRHLIPHSPVLQKLVELEESSGVRFKYIRLLAKAFTHASMQYSTLTRGSYENLEHLGDAILQFLVSDYLYHRFPTLHEGHFTLLRISLVQNKQLAELCKQLGFDQYIRAETPEIGVKIQADVVESYLAALLLDKGLHYCQKFLEVCLFPKLTEFIERSEIEDVNTRLQKIIAGHCRQLQVKHECPVYRQLGASLDPPFTVGVYFKGQRLGTGAGHSLRDARRSAAEDAFQKDLLRLVGMHKK